MDVASTTNKKTDKPSDSLPAHHPINIIYRTIVISTSLWALHKFEVYHAILRDPNVNHTVFKIGLAASIGISGIKGYLELYEGKMRKQKIEYQNYKSSTHAVMILWIIATICFNAALWNALGGLKTMLVLLIFSFGVLIQLMLLLPTSVQNIITFIGLTFFLQMYK